MSTIAFAQRAARLPVVPVPVTSPHVISFESGHAFPQVLPDLTEAAAIALSKYRPEALQYAPRPGLPELREWIAEYMRNDGIRDASADRVLVVNGAKHGLELVCRLLIDDGDVIVVTAPTYFTAIPIFRSFGVRFMEVTQDSEGLNVDELAEIFSDCRRQNRPLPKFVYDVPDFHNPTGITMSLERRKKLIALCAEHGVLIVEDSPYRKVRFEGESLPPLKALDSEDSVIMLGTFSKLLAPGLRVGWISATPEVLSRVVQLKSDGGSCPLTQRIILEFCRAGRLPLHISHVQAIYREHRDHMVAAIRREMPYVVFAVPEGGYYLWLTLPDRMDGNEVARRAADKSVNVLAGSKFFAGPAGESRNDTMRLAYSHATLQEIDDGIGRLSQIVHSL